MIFIKKLKGILPVAGIFLTGLSHVAEARQAASSPNIIFFLVDDMGWEDTSVPFWDSITAANRKFRTPNMERLAATAEKFTNAYANSICTPSRVSLMTGMNAARHRVTNWTAFKDKAVDPENDLLKIPEWNVNGLSPAPEAARSVYATPLPQLLKAHGYYTIQCGKAHFGAHETPGADPLNLGFMKNIGGSAAGNPASYLAEADFGRKADRYVLQADIPHMTPYWGTNTFLTEDLTKEAIRAMDTARMLNRPFFLYMAHYAVHLPYNADPRFTWKYLAEGYTAQEAAYCALVEGMDESLGELMYYLAKHRLTENTIVIFMSDNGGFSHPPREGKPDSQNYPLRAGKGSLYEGGIREPMMIKWPGVTRPGSICSQYVAIQDFYPTILEMAGITDYNSVQKVDGMSMVPYLRDPALRDSGRDLVWNFPNNWSNKVGGDYNFMTAIRQGDWKLIYLQRYGRLELYNLKDDIGEQHDLAKDNPGKTKALAALLTGRLKAYNAQRPTYVDTGKPVPWPDEIR